MKNWAFTALMAIVALPTCYGCMAPTGDAQVDEQTATAEAEVIELMVLPIFTKQNPFGPTDMSAVWGESATAAGIPSYKSDSFRNEHRWVTGQLTNVPANTEMSWRVSSWHMDISEAECDSLELRTLEFFKPQNATEFVFKKSTMSGGTKLMAVHEEWDDEGHQVLVHEYDKCVASLTTTPKTESSAGTWREASTLRYRAGGTGAWIYKSVNATPQ